MSQEIYRAAIRALSTRTLAVLRIAGAVVAFAGIALLALDTAFRAVGVGFMVAGAMIIFLMPWRAVSVSTKRAAPALAAPWRYEIGEGGIKASTPIGSSEFLWPQLTGVQEQEEFWLLHTKIKRQAVIVVKAAFSEEDRRTAAGLISSHLGAGRPVAAPGPTPLRPPAPTA